MNDPIIIEDPRTTWRRRLQQRRCLVCGARQLARGGSYFCARHIASYRYCTTCETLRETAAHGKDSRCKACAARRALAAYHADPDRCLYRIVLREISQRASTRGDQIFDSMRRRIALAAFVARTPGWTWTARGRAWGIHPKNLSLAYRAQCRGEVRDPDAPDRTLSQGRKKEL